jgi:hypothetical protein
MNPSHRRGTLRSRRRAQKNKTLDSFGNRVVDEWAHERCHVQGFSADHVYAIDVLISVERVLVCRLIMPVEFDATIGFSENPRARC